MTKFIRDNPKLTATAGLIFAAGLYFILRPARETANGSTFVARRGPLDIMVLASGTIEALEKQEIRCEVRGEQVKILKIVDEGYFVTEDDVRTNKVLVELDASKLQQNLVNQDITFQSTVSALTEAQQGFQIQQTQNRVDVKTAEQDAKFAFMDAEKYLGDRIMAELVEQLDLQEQTNDPPALLSSTNTLATAVSPRKVTTIDYSRYAKAELLGDGMAKQELRKREDEVFTSRTALSQAQTKLAGTKRLFEKGFVTKTELEADQTAGDQGRLKLESAETSKDLFIKYEFPKQAEELVGKFEKALRSLERSRKEAVSKFAQAEAKLRGAEGRHQIERDNLNEIKDMIRKCVITAGRSGLVAYGGGDDGMYWGGGRDPIRVGSQVFERQVILTIPDTSKVGVKLQINETHIKKMKKGLTARITAEAQPEDKLTGEVSKVGVLPDSRNRWMSPDMNVYLCSVNVKGTRDWLKPGMSTKVEILVKQLPDCVYIPLQAVSVVDGKQVVYMPGINPVAKRIEVGEFNDEFIEIKSGLAAGDVVLLRAPDSEKKSESESPEGKKPEAPPAAPPAAVPVSPVVAR